MVSLLAFIRDVCAADMYSLVRGIFRSCEVPAVLNRTLITLVPKVENPLTMMQLRPISLCNTFYKVLTKILVGRLRPLMKHLVSPNQVSFIPGRFFSDNITLAQELLNKFGLRLRKVLWLGRLTSPRPIIELDGIFLKGC